MRYILDGYASPELISEIEKVPSTKKLILEMHYKYGLQVIRKASEPDDRLSFLMGYEANGLPICNVWTVDVPVSSGMYPAPKSGLTYYVRTPYHNKERGGGREDRETTYSTKLPSLMGVLKRNKVITNYENAMNILTHSFEGCKDSIESSHSGSDRKDKYLLDTDDVHALLKKAIGETTNWEGLHLDIDKCKIALDKYNEAHTIRLKKQEDSRRFFHNNFYFVGSDGVDLFVGMFRKTTGTVQFKNVGGFCNATKYEVIKPLKRIKEFLDEHGDVLGKLVMAKVAMEDKCDTYYRDYIPRIGVYNADLDMAFNNNIVGNGNTNQYMMQYVLIPTEHNE
jgi:hypothetical protein